MLLFAFFVLSCKLSSWGESHTETIRNVMEVEKTNGLKQSAEGWESDLKTEDGVHEESPSCDPDGPENNFVRAGDELGPSSDVEHTRHDSENVQGRH